MTTQQILARTVAELFTREEWALFVDTGTSGALARGEVFMLDESRRLLGERALAEQLRCRMIALGLAELASRIDPGAFPEGELARALRAVPAAG